MFGFKKKNKVDKNLMVLLPNLTFPKEEPFSAVQKQDYERLLGLGLDLKEMLEDASKDIRMIDVKADPLYTCHREEEEMQSNVYSGMAYIYFIYGARVIGTLRNYDENGHFLSEAARKKNAAEVGRLCKLGEIRKNTKNRWHDMDLHGLILFLTMSGFTQEMMTPVCDLFSKKYRALLEEKMADPKIIKTYAELEKITKNMDTFDGIMAYADTRTFECVSDAFWNNMVYPLCFPEMDKYIKFFFALRKKWGLHDGLPEHDLVIAELDKIIMSDITTKDCMDKFAQMYTDWDTFEEFLEKDGVFPWGELKGDREGRYELLMYAPEGHEIFTKMMKEYAVAFKKYYLEHVYGIQNDVLYSGNEEPTADLQKSLEVAFGMTAMNNQLSIRCLEKKPETANGLSVAIEGGYGENGFHPTFNTSITDIIGLIEENFDIDEHVNYLREGRGENYMSAMSCFYSIFINFYGDMVYLSAVENLQQAADILPVCDKFLKEGV